MTYKLSFLQLFYFKRINTLISVYKFSQINDLSESISRDKLCKIHLMINFPCLRKTTNHRKIMIIVHDGWRKWIEKAPGESCGGRDIAM